MMNKKGDSSVDISVSKLVAIILAAIFLILFIVGYTSGILSPVIERVGSALDSVIIGFKELNNSVQETNGAQCSMQKEIEYKYEDNILNLIYQKCTDGFCHIKSTDSNVPIIQMGINNIYEIKLNSTHLFYKKGNSDEWITQNIDLLNNLADEELLQDTQNILNNIYSFNYNELDEEVDVISYSFYKKILEIKETVCKDCNNEMFLTLEHINEKDNTEIKKALDNNFLEFLKEINSNIVVSKDEIIYNDDTKNTINESNSYIVYLDKKKYGIFNLINEDEKYANINYVSVSEDFSNNLHLAEYIDNKWIVRDSLANTHYNIDLIKAQNDLYAFAKGVCE